MKFTFNWLKEHLETSHTLDEILIALTNVGLEVESADNPAAKYAAFKTAKVVEAVQHPNADRLRVLKVQTAEGLVQVVCGAPNARQGLVGIFAPSGSYIPGLDVTLKASKIRDVESNGMMVSEREMQLSDEHNGIIELAETTAIGLPMADVMGLNDAVIDVAITPNRPDCAGVRGIARDLAAAGYGTLKPLPRAGIEPVFTTPITVSIADESTCPQFLGRLVKNVKNGPSPEWLQQRLRAIGLRPISALVDITNFFTIGLNRPLHVFDADKLKGNITVRASKEGESFLALNDKTYTLTNGMTVVCDDSGVLGLGGIMGGASTGVSETTTNVYIECAYFNPTRTAITGRELQINSDARYRFERGIDPANLADMIDNATAMVLEICGGQAGSVVGAGHAPSTIKTITYRLQRLETLGGLSLPADRQKTILQDLGFSGTMQGDTWQLTCPSWRPDLDGEADIVEEICRIHGYDNIPAQSLMVKQAQTTVLPLTPLLARKLETKRVLAGRGLHECVTWSFMEKSLAASFSTAPLNNALTLTNPIASDLNHMRPSILPNLIQAAQRNADRGHPNAALFEVGPVFNGVGVNDQPYMAAGVRHCLYAPANWQGNDNGRAVTALDAKADVLAVLEALGCPVDRLQTVTTNLPAYYHPNQSCALVLGKFTVALCGTLHPKALEAAKAEGPMVGFELFLENLPPVKTGKKPLLQLSAFQPVERDFAFVVKSDTAADVVLKAAFGADKNLIEKVELFDVYQGKGLEADEKSLAIRVTLQPREKTLLDAEIEAVAQAVIKAVSLKAAARLR